MRKRCREQWLVEIGQDNVTRGGAKARPFYNVVATDSRNRRDGRFIERVGFHRLGLAVSLNAPNDAIRSSIMPINRSAPMAALREELLSYPKRRNAAICVE